jgi:hypothetical protein
MCQESNTKLRKKISIENQPHVTMSHESADQNNDIVHFFFVQHHGMQAT